MSAAAASDFSAPQHEVLALVAEAGTASLDSVLEQVVGTLQTHFSHYTGVYLYWMDDPDALVLRAYRGRPTEHTRIPVERGICGRAAREKRTVIVDDVTKDPSYLACSLETRAEIVVPIMKDGKVLGEIDIDSDVPVAFTDADRRFLEDVAAAVAAHA